MALCLSLNDLPPELIEFVAYKQTLSYSDVLSFQSCSRALYHVLHGSDETWRTKFLQRWPLCIKTEEFKKIGNWKALYVQREFWEQRIKGVVEDTMHLLIHKEETPKCIVEAAFKDLPLYGEDYMTECVIDSLFQHCSPKQNPPMSLQYYSLRLVQRLHSEWLRRKWERRPTTSKTGSSTRLEDGLRFIAQFMEADQDYRSGIVDKFLCYLVKKVITRIGTTDRSLADNVSAFVNGSTSDRWTPLENTCIIEELTTCMREDHLDRDAVAGTLEKSLLAETAMFSIEVACFAAACAAERLGVRCKLQQRVHTDIFPPSIRFVGYDRVKKKDAQGFIDFDLTLRYRAFESHHQSFLSLTQAMRLYVSLATGQTVTLAITETKHYLDPRNQSIALRLMHTYLMNLINIDEAKGLMELSVRKGAGCTLLSHRFSTISKEDELKPPADLKIRHRTAEINAKVWYSVGQIMRHRVYGYRCVIYGWTEKCVASQRWITQMGVDQLELGPGQAFYSVLVADGTSRYAAQENLKFHKSPVAVCHPCIGKYFASYEGTHYLMNSAAASLYPHDTQHTNDTVLKLYNR